MTETLDARLLPRLQETWRAMADGSLSGYARDLADDLATTEAQLVAAGCGPDGTVTRLKPEWAALLNGLPAVGEVMVLTRNDHAVHEKVGVFGNISLGAHAGLVLNGAIDLRLFHGAWASAFAVSTTSRHGPRRSIQIFDRHGEAVLKIHRREATDAAAFEALIASLTAEDQSPLLSVEPPKARTADRPDDAVELDTLRQGWRDLRDVHHFRALLDKAGAGRLQALRLIGQEFAEEVETSALRQVIGSAATAALPIMVFVGNRGCVQIHSGPVERIVARDPWINIMDPGFTLHLREDAIASAWVVRKPQSTGTVTALELYDARGEVIAILYGVRPEQDAEREDWRALLAGLPRRGAAAVAVAAAE